MSKADLDKYFPRNGPCMFHRTLYARHRVIDAIKDSREGGDTVTQLALDFQVSRAAILAALESRPDDNRMTAKEIRESE